MERGDAIDTGGTSGGLAVYWDAPVEVPGAWVAPAPIPDRWLVGGAMTATGRALDWLADDVLGGVPVETLIAEAATVPPGCDGLVFLPYLAGERSPLWDPDARGAFVGLTLAHGRGHLARAVLEAAAYALRHVAAPDPGGGPRDRSPRRDRWHGPERGVEPDQGRRPRRAGGRAGGPRDGPPRGGDARRGRVGLHPDLRSAIRAMARVDHRLEPDPDAAAAYDAGYAAYVDLWPRIAPIVHRLGEERATG